MVIPTVGAIVAVKFPYSDLSQTKVRPAVVLASAGRGDWVLCQITSNQYGDSSSVTISSMDMHVGSLALTSYARTAKLLTANEGILVRVVAELKKDKLNEVLNAAIYLFQGGLT